MRNCLRFLSTAVLVTVFFVTQVIAKPVELDWDALIPDEGKGAVVAIPKNGTIVGALKKEDYSDLTKEEFEDTVLYYEEQREDQSKSISIRTDLHGKSIRIAGYVTPVEIDGDNVTGFLLVPYIGACVHVPAPPGNQMVYISGAKKLKLDDIYDPIWVTGKLQARPLTTLYAQVGYQIADPEIQPYD